MAEKIQHSSQLRLVLEQGIKEDGKPDLKTKSYMDIQPGSSADALITASETIASLQSLPLVEINEVVTFSLLK
ncbi:DUF1659 domain-containing protein [Priestia megaterium]|uniref:DUF1659 domain-containing protein n=1 Tax=Priestia megaterium TaxID=1404 RepID=UPI00207AB850|nr:DUF1659 domain-containing protein [Priestia megaterium]USL40648.1 DUF1659 domain-containing protein [Priestia megaterium]